MRHTIAAGFIAGQLILTGCGTVEMNSQEKQKSDKETATLTNESEANRNNNASQKKGSELPDADGVAQSPVQGPQVTAELRSNDIQFDLAVAAIKIGDKVNYQTGNGAVVGIEDVYYGSTFFIDGFDLSSGPVKAEFESWAIASSSTEKKWLETTCAEQTPGPDGTVNSICEIVGPIEDAKREIVALPAGSGEAEILAILKKIFPDETFSIVATVSKAEFQISQDGETVWLPLQAK